jgi:hypothetical protein
MHVHSAVPHFAVTTIDGVVVRYADVWQSKPLVLILLCEPLSADARAYADYIAQHLQTFAAYEAACVVTTERVQDFTAPAAVIADRWGEIMFAASGDVRVLPGADAIVEWLQHVQHRCPECEGEAR